MEHVPTLSLVVITLLQLCRAQSSNSTPEWYAANDINDTNFSPKPITELFSTETSFSPQDPIVVFSPSSSLPSNRGIVSSPSPITQYGDSTDSQPPPNVIPLLSGTELPSSPPLPSFAPTSSDTRSPQTPSTTIQQTSTPEPALTSRTTQEFSTSSNQPPVQLQRDNVSQNLRPNQQTFVSNRPQLQQQQPRNVQFLLPSQMGNRIFQGQQLSPNGQPNVFVLYEQAPQNILNPLNLQNAPLPQPIGPTMVQGPNIIRQPSQLPNQFFPQSNALPQPNIPPPNNIITTQRNMQQQINQAPINQLPGNGQQLTNPLLNNQIPANPTLNIQQPNIRLQQPINQMPLPPNAGVVARQRPLRQRNRLEGGRLNTRRPYNINAPDALPCQGVNGTAVRPTAATKTQNSVITIRLRPSEKSRDTLQINRNSNSTVPTTVRSRQSFQVNTRNYERCLNSCRDKKDRICAGPEGNRQLNPEALKGFPSMCHMACHNTFRANPIYERITNGRCGKLRTRIQTVEKTKVRRDELKKSQYTIISNVPGTVVELAP